MSELTVIPDSIEPYKGYKALNVAPDGTLWSPSEKLRWPVKQRAEAHCTRGLSQWSWVPVEGKPREMDATKMVRPGNAIVTTAVWVSSTTTRPVPSQNAIKPSNPLPPGWSWSWEPLTHDAPAEGCSCGLYAVSQPVDCLSYVQPEGVIVEVAVWGKVVPASRGVRGQYAYPQSILSPGEIVDELMVTAKLYEIPIVVLDPPRPELASPPRRPPLPTPLMQPGPILSEQLDQLTDDRPRSDPVAKAIKDAFHQIRKKK